MFLEKKGLDRNDSILARQNNVKITDTLSAGSFFTVRDAFGNFGNLFIMTMQVTLCNLDIISSGNLIVLVRTTLRTNYAC